MDGAGFCGCIHSLPAAPPPFRFPLLCECVLMYVCSSLPAHDAPLIIQLRPRIIITNDLLLLLSEYLAVTPNDAVAAATGEIIFQARRRPTRTRCTFGGSEAWTRRRPRLTLPSSPGACVFPPLATMVFPPSDKCLSNQRLCRRRRHWARATSGAPASRAPPTTSSRPTPTPTLRSCRRGT